MSLKMYSLVLISITIWREYKGARTQRFKNKTISHSQTLKTAERCQYKKWPPGKDHIKDETEILGRA